MVTDPGGGAAAVTPTVTVERSFEPTVLGSGRGWRARWETVEAFIAFLRVDLALATGGFPRLRRAVTRTAIKPVVPPRPGAIERVTVAIDHAALCYVRPALCLQRSAVATRLLRRRGVPAEMVIGVRKIPFYAHAWVEVDGVVENDKASVKEQYPELERF